MGCDKLKCTIVLWCIITCPLLGVNGQNEDSCDPNPCQNGGTCFDSGSEILCRCPSFTSGENCSQLTIIGCWPSPCLNGGTCIDVPGSFMCDCPPEYTGIVCGTPTDECDPNPCLNGGTCIDGVGSFTCDCEDGYSGDTCEINIDDCDPNPCQNGGTCNDGVNMFTCVCEDDFTGETCDTVMCPVLSAPQNGTIDCSLGDDGQPNPGDFCLFACDDGFVLSRSDRRTCLESGAWSGLETACREGEDRCDSDPCQNGGTCILNGRCECLPLWTGPYCDIPVVGCWPSPCQNGGTCEDVPSSFLCQCPDDFTGIICETIVDNCDPNPCQNDGNCTDGVNSFTCDCVDGFSGDNCEVDINDCVSFPCLNGGTCINGVNSFTCICAPDHTGVTCSTIIDDCNPNPCQNGGTCTDGINTFTCDCQEDFTGIKCEENDCDPNPCLNGGDCTDGINSFTCECEDGYSGDTCQMNIDDCDPNPCLNGGSCNDGVNMFTCDCALDFTGVTCETVVDDCESDPCQNGGTCTDRIFFFTCECLDGFTGFTCQTAICPPLTAPDNGMIECIIVNPTPSPEPTPGPTNSTPVDQPNPIDYVTGDICMFTCDDGYEISGSENRTCGDDGIWSGDDVTCTVPPGACQPLTAPENGMIQCDFGDDGFATKRDECTFTCDDGFELKGSDKRKCLVWRGRTRWSGDETICKEVTCPALSAPANGMIECISGVPTPRPEPTPAPEPTPPVNKRFLQYFFRHHNDDSEYTPGSSIGDVCTFTCGDGYVISGSDSRTCGDDGNWSGTRTTCDGTCPPLTAPDNGMIDCSLGDDGVATHLDQCTFTCDDSYRRKYGTSWLRKCIVYRGYARWTGRTTVCVDVDTKGRGRGRGKDNDDDDDD